VSIDLSHDDIYLFNEGRHFRLYEHLGAHATDDAVTFAVWAPNAVAVSLVGDRNGWRPGAHPLQPRESSGIWMATLPEWQLGDCYKFHIEGSNGYQVDKADPFAFEAEEPPKTGSVVASLAHEWRDSEWMATRAGKQHIDEPISIYEVHLGSWRLGAGGERLGYREVAPLLARHALDHGFTHVELLPIMEHPFYGSWGYQTTGYFAPTKRYGTPSDFMEFVEILHAAGIGVILDWVPSHFPSDEHALGYFDGTHLFEHADPKQGFHPDWNSLIFNYGRSEVRAFLISSACFWLDKYHIDGIRVDAVASMLYLDYSRKEGEWVPNQYGGRENLDAIAFMRQLNEVVYGDFDGIQTYAEESTAWPMVSRPTYLGGLGFGMKWDMGWMHDTLHYLARDPIHRRFHHNELTFRAIYAGSENYVLPLSHDEVVHGKGSLAAKMPGDGWQKLANLRLLLAYEWALPAKKLLFMGGEVGQWNEWDHEGSVEWHLLADSAHAGIGRLVADLNRTLRAEPALYAQDTDWHGFQWAVADDGDNSSLAFFRYAKDGSPMLWIGNFTPVVRDNFRTPVPRGGHWVEVLNSDAESYGGSGVGNLGSVEALPAPMGEHNWSLTLTLPPLGALLLKPA
jgi:1,4-alpha-glucan branching enzyme